MSQNEQHIEKTFTANGTSDAFVVCGEFPVSIEGLTAAGAGSVLIERSSNNGVTYAPVKLPDFSDAAFTSDAEFNIVEKMNVKYRFVLSSYSSGSIVCRIGYKPQG